MGQWPSVARRLCDDGLHIEPNSHNFAHLRRYLTGALPEKRITLVNCTGWHGESVFVVGAVAIGGTTGETVRPAPGVEVNELLNRGGTFEAWREVMALMPGNSRMLLAVSAAFAAPLLRMTGAEQGGFHFHGKSSTGKSTTLYAAGSVWGGGKATGFLRQWSMTKTALEAKLALHNDLPITLDEIHQANPKDIGPMIYAAANGIGKARGRADGSLHQGKEWQTLIISSGERSAVDIIRDAGHTVRAGQEVRLSDIYADSEAGYGVFEDIHGFPNAAAFAEHIKAATVTNFGWAGPMFVERAIAEHDMVVEFVEQTRQAFLAEVVPEGADGQVRRVANRFALAAAAGELATFWGIVPWETNEAAIAAQLCFDSWLDRRGGIGAAEDIRGVEQVLATLDADGMALFAKWNEPTTKEQFGWRKQSNDGAWEYFATSEGFTRLIGQRDKKAMEAALVKAGVLAVEADGKHGKVWNACGKSARLHRLRLIEAAAE